MPAAFLLRPGCACAGARARLLQQEAPPPAAPDLAVRGLRVAPPTPAQPRVKHRAVGGGLVPRGHVGSQQQELGHVRQLKGQAG